MKSNISDKDLGKALDMVYHLEMCAMAAMVFGLAFAVTFVVSPLFGYYIHPRDWIDLKVQRYPLPKVGNWRVLPFFLLGLSLLVWRTSKLPFGQDQVPLTLICFFILFCVISALSFLGVYIYERQVKK